MAHTSLFAPASKPADTVNEANGRADAFFDVISLFAKGELHADHWVGAIKSVSLRTFSTKEKPMQARTRKR